MSIFAMQAEQALASLVEAIGLMAQDEQIDTLNQVRSELHRVSPQREPVDLVQWVPAESVAANNYNPNHVAPPEMRLLYRSIKEDGYTQPIVVYHDEQQGKYIVVDGFHRNRVGREHPDIRERIHGYLPVVVIDKPIEDRMASTIRHNRARGRHAVEPMSDLVADLYRAGWRDDRIAKELGMDLDEVLRLKQITGLPEIFKDRDYSRAWE